jgi:hypothetical protein
MLLTIDNLAHRYNCLPSQALEYGTTFDLHVLDLSAKWSKYQHDRAEQGNEHAKPIPKLSQEQLKAMMERARSEK